MGRGPLKNGLKGPRFPSFEQARQSAKQREVFIPHTRYRAATRNLKNACVHAERLDDELSVNARRRLREAVKDEPFATYAYYHLLNAAWEAHDATGVSLAESLTYLLDKFDAQKADNTAITQAVSAPPTVEITG